METPNLKIPLIAGGEHVEKAKINAQMQAIDGAALPLSHAESKAHFALWQPAINYQVGDIARVEDCPSWGYLECTVGGISGEASPACPYGEGDTVADGAATWILRRIVAGIKQHGDLQGRNKVDQHPIAAITGLPDALDAREAIQNKGQPDGYASLDANGRIPLSQIPANIKEMRVVATIAARNALAGDDLYDGLRVRVLDATGDPSVSSGWAEYMYDAANAAWVKTAEKESIDVVLDWANLQHIPDLLTRLSMQGGKLCYDGTPLNPDIRSVTFVGGDSQIIYPWDGAVQTIQITCTDPRDTDLVFGVERQTKSNYTAKADIWDLVGGSLLTLPAGEVYGEYAMAGFPIAAGDVIRASTAGDDLGVTFQVIIKNN